MFKIKKEGENLRMKQEYLLGKNNYCLTNHKMTENKGLKSIDRYLVISKGLCFENGRFEKVKDFDYEKFLLEG